MRKYLPTLAELIDRLSIIQLKEVFIPEYKKEYGEEIRDILHDIDEILSVQGTVLEDDACGTQQVKTSKADSGKNINANIIRAIIVLSQMNTHIWYNESQVRKGEKGADNLMLTHGLNGIRNTSKNIIQEIVGGRKDYKIDCIAAEFKDWEVSWNIE